MDNRKFESGASASPPSAPVSPSSGYPTNGNPGTGTPATVPGEWWFHQVGEELRAVLDAGGITPDHTDLTQLRDAIYSIVGVGAIAFFAKNTAPTGWLKANGAAVSRTTYAALFAAIGTTFGAGDGSTTFNLPDLRGEFIRGWDDGRGVDSARSFGSSQSESVKYHSHYLPTSSGGASDPAWTLKDTTWDGSGYTGGSDALSWSNVNTTPGVGGPGGQAEMQTPESKGIIHPSLGTETRPRNIALLACIKY